VQVAQAAASTSGDARLLAVYRQVGDHVAAVQVRDYGADRHPQDQILGTLAVAVRAAPLFAVVGLEFARIAVIDQGVDVAVGYGVDAAATTAVAAIRSAERDELFAAERGGPVATLAGDHFDFCFVDEFHEVCLVPVAGNFPGRRRI